MMKTKTFGPWEPFQIEIIKNNERSHVTIMRRRKPNGTYEFQDTSTPLVKMLNPRENNPHVNFSPRNPKTTTPTTSTDT